MSEPEARYALWRDKIVKASPGGVWTAPAIPGPMEPREWTPMLIEPGIPKVTIDIYGQVRIAPH